jgi:hypothetical protein
MFMVTPKYPSAIQKAHDDEVLSNMVTPKYAFFAYFRLAMTKLRFLATPKICVVCILLTRDYEVYGRPLKPGS